MNDWTEPLDFNDYIAVSSRKRADYPHTVKADKASNGGSYQENNKKILAPRSKPGSSFITLPRPKSAIASIS